MDLCSEAIEAQINKEILSCKTIRHLLVSPISGEKTIIDGKIIKEYCYGQEVGLFLNKTLMNNWFCIEKIEQIQTGLPYEGFPGGGI